MRTPAPILVVLLVACGSAERVDTTALAAPGATDVFCDIEHGSLVYVGDPEKVEQGEKESGEGHGRRFEVGVGVWAEGGRAEKKLDAVEWGFQYLSQPAPATNDEGGLLDLWGRSHAEGAGVDFAVVGPTDMDLEVVLLDGWVELYDLRGDALVTANGVYGGGLSGNLDLYASADGMELDLEPVPGDSITLQAQGDVVIALPFGVPVDLEVVGDPDWGVTVADLGFDQLEVFPDYVHAVGGEGSIPISIVVGGGAFVLLQADPEPETP